MKVFHLLGVVFLCGCLFITQSMASDPSGITISVPDMHCAGCAKKLTTELAKVPGVSKAEADVESKTVTLTPKSKQTPSPKALWEAVEKAGKTPSKLVSQQGTFNEKPSK